MKKLILLFSLSMMFATFPSYGQDYAHQTIKTSATEAAAQDASIVKKVDANTGVTHFYRKATCPNSGQVILTDVEFCTKSGKFVDVASYGKISCKKSSEKKAVVGAASACGSKCSPEQRANCTAACAAACGKAKSEGTGKAQLVSNNN